MTAVEWFQDQIIKIVNGTCELSEIQIYEKAKEMEKEQKIEFACKVVEVSSEKYIQGKTTWQIAEELLTFKSE